MDKVLIIDDHLLFADGLKMLLEEQYELAVECTANTEGLLQDAAQLNRYKLLIVDLNMPGLNGFNLLEACKTYGVKPSVVIVSGSDNQSDIERAISLGAQAFIPKDATTDEMLEGISKVLDGYRFLPEKWLGQVNWLVDDVDSQPMELKLSTRQIQVLDMISDGLRNKQIALVLGVSESAIKSHVEILLRELNVSNRTACVVEGIRLGLIAAKN